MSTTESKRFKKFNNENVSDDDKLVIGSLNDDCLIQIFEHLCITDRLKIELVCTRWNDIGKRSWSNIKSLKIDRKMNGDFDFYWNKKYASKFIVNVLQRCGVYLEHLWIKIVYSNSYLDSLLNDVSKYCSNINSFYINVLYDNHSYSMEGINFLFKNNRKLSKITFKNFKFNSNCLLNLCVDSIKEIYFNYSFDRLEGFYTFFSNLKSIEKIKLDLRIDFDINKLILILNKSNCKSIQEFNLQSGNGHYDHQILQYFLKQEKLSLLRLKNLEINRTFLERLSTINSIKELEINYDDEISFCIHRFENLTTLKCRVNNLTDISIKNLTKCVNLKSLEFQSIQNYSLSSDGESYFSAFKNLEDFKLTCANNVDNILKSISNCKNMKNLRISECLFTLSSGLTYLCSLTNLIYLEFENSLITDSELIHLLEKLINLKQLYICNCENLTANFLNTVSDLKINRNDNNILEISHIFCNEFEKTLPKDVNNASYSYPLILLIDYGRLAADESNE